MQRMDAYKYILNICPVRWNFQSNRLKIAEYLQAGSSKILLLFKLFIGLSGYIYIDISSHTSFIPVASTRLRHTTNNLGSVTPKAVAVLSIVVLAITAFAANDAIRVR
jgi:hypothetical protein